MAAPPFVGAAQDTLAWALPETAVGGAGRPGRLAGRKRHRSVG